MFFLTPAHEVATVLKIMHEDDNTTKLESFILLLVLNGLMITVLCLFSVRWSRQITNSVAVLNEYTSMLKKS